MTQISRLEVLKELTAKELLHEELGAYSFAELKPQLIPILSMIVRMGNVIESKHEEIPKDIIENTEKFTTAFYQEIYSLISYNNSEDIDTGLAIRRRLIADIHSVLKQFTDGRYSDIPIGFYTLYGTVISFENESHLLFESLNTNIDSLEEKIVAATLPIENQKIDFDVLINKSEELLKKLTTEGQKKITDKYALIFKEQADIHKKNSEMWIKLIVGAIIGLILIIVFEDRLIPIDSDKATIITLDYLRRLLLISFIIYVTSFFIKQYGIQKHLQTLNTHRQNTLSSFDLFIKSMGSDDSDVRSVLMKEIARAIYESGQTGYIGSKDDGGGASSITEITKILKPDS